MGWFSKPKGYKWSLYFVQNGNEVVYLLHENSVIRLLGSIMSQFKENSSPINPWTIHLNFNKTHENIILKQCYFNQDGHDISPELMQQITAIDDDWMVKGGEPIFIEAATKTEIPMRNPHLSFEHTDIQAMLNKANKPEERTFFTVVNKMFNN